jgi:KUP system potassium uptake protein
LKAFNPYFAFEYLIRHKEKAWRSLGGILLSFTGVEALFADIGAFSRPAIQLSWLGLAYPCILIAYSGQAAYINQHPEAYSNPFYNSVPPGWLIFSLIIAIAAAIVASQAMITATFQASQSRSFCAQPTNVLKLLAQIMKLSYFPQIKIVHTSTTYHGQIYVPSVNWLLMIGTVLVAAIYNNTTSLGNAYGMCVMFVTFFDTCMVTLVAILVWRVPPYLVFLPWLVVISFDGAFLSSALTKVPDGAWFTLLLASILASIFILWRFGKEQQWFAEASDRFPTTHFVKTSQDGALHLTEQFGNKPIGLLEGFGIFFDKAGETTPIVFSQFIRKLAALPQVIVFFHLRPLDQPFVAPEDRYSVSRLAVPNCYRLVVRHGYMDEIVTPDLASLIFEKIRTHVVKRALEPEGKEPSTITLADTARPIADLRHLDDRSVESKKAVDINVTGQCNNVNTAEISTPSHNLTALSRLETLEHAYNHEVIYIIGKGQMKVSPGTHIMRRFFIKAFLFIRDSTRPKIASLDIPMDKVVEVGFVKDI